MYIFLIGLLLFFGIHSISIINEPYRDRIANQIGEWPWKGLYSLVAITGFILIIWGYGVARYDSVVLYTPPPWLQQISLLLLLPVFPLLIAAYFPGRIKAVTKHPMLLSTKLWAAAHLFMNGSLINVILFGTFFVWAVWDRISLQHRQLRPIPVAPSSNFNDIIACVIGLGLYFAFVYWLHALLIGVSLF